LEEPGASPLVVLDVGLGAGSNALCAWRASERRLVGKTRLLIVSFDQSLAALELVLDPPRAGLFGLTPAEVSVMRRLRMEGAAAGRWSDWRLRLGRLPEVLDESTPAADIVFWDPFSPAANPELWTVAAFSALRARCRAQATVHTYSGATRTRSALLLSGFAVGSGELVGSGRISTIAATDLASLEQPLDRRWFERLTRSSAPFPEDAPPDALERVRALPQFCATR
jgi:queuine tRNA-ribosyltransferase